MKDIALLLGVTIILFGAGWYLYGTVTKDKSSSDNPVGAIGTDSPIPLEVTDFLGCVAAGNPVMESYPRQCRHEGVLYVEEVPPPVELPLADEPTGPVACTMDAKICPDGSAVGRVAPNCAFAPCPGENDTIPAEFTTCSADSRLAEACIEIYEPVCGLVEVQCITAPCDPVPETFSNACFACQQSNVIGYEAGACLNE